MVISGDIPWMILIGLIFVMLREVAFFLDLSDKYHLQSEKVNTILRKPKGSANVSKATFNRSAESEQMESILSIDFLFGRQIFVAKTSIPV